MTDEWISVNDDLPNHACKVLIWNGNDYEIAKSVAYPNFYGDRVFALNVACATHWQYLPEPPKQE